MKGKRIWISLAKAVLALSFWFAVWAMVSFRIDSELLFPSPFSVGKTLIVLLQTKEFWLTMLLSLLRVLWGILASLLIGSMLAYLTTQIKLLHILISPALSAIKSTPVASFIILALLWLERDILPVLITALIVVPIVWANVSEGIRGVDPELKEVAFIYRFSLQTKFHRLYLPSVAPYFMAACKSSLGMAWKAGIAAEILATPKHSIGTELYFSKTYLETPTLFAWTLVVILLSIMIEKLFVFGLERLGRRWHLLPQGGQHAEHS